MAIGSKIVWTFLIGLIAGMAPFLFMQLLPALLMPTQLESFFAVARAPPRRD